MDLDTKIKYFEWNHSKYTFVQKILQVAATHANT